MKVIIASLDQDRYDQLPASARRLVDQEEGEQHATRQDGLLWLSWTYRFPPEIWRRLRPYSHFFTDEEGRPLRLPEPKLFDAGRGTCRFCRAIDAGPEGNPRRIGPRGNMFPEDVPPQDIAWIDPDRTVCAACAETIVSGGYVKVWNDGRIEREVSA